MRLYTVLLLVGVALVGSGIGWAEYYAIAIYPTVAAHIATQCPYDAPCAVLAPAYLQPPFITGEEVVILGLVVLVAGAIWRVATRAKLRTSSPSPLPPVP